MLPSDRESWKTYLYVFSALSEMNDSSYRVFSISVEELFTKFEIRWVILQISSWKFSWTFSTLFDISWCKNWKILTNWIFCDSEYSNVIILQQNQFTIFGFRISKVPLKLRSKIKFEENRDSLKVWERCRHYAIYIWSLGIKP